MLNSFSIINDFGSNLAYFAAKNPFVLESEADEEENYAPYNLADSGECAEYSRNSRHGDHDQHKGRKDNGKSFCNIHDSDCGNRKFILVEMMDYADSITAERVKRVINGYGEGKNAVKGTGGNFSFYDLGDTLLLSDGNLNENIGESKIHDYIWYTETKESKSNNNSTDEPYFLGSSRDTAYYFYYKKNKITTLDYDFLSTVKTKAAGYIIYADLCTISDEELKKWNIIFKKIPRDIAKV